MSFDGYLKMKFNVRRIIYFFYKLQNKRIEYSLGKLLNYLQVKDLPDSPEKRQLQQSINDDDVEN